MDGEVSIAEPTEFQITVKNCGTDTSNSSYKKDTDESALRLAERTLVGTVQDFIGTRPKDVNQFMYDIAVMTLGRVLKDDFDGESVIDDIEKMQDEENREEFRDAWKIAQEDDSNE